MPLPTPRDNEKRDQFLHRCMGDEVMIGDYAEEKQRFAVCNKQWRRAIEMTEKWFPILKTGTHEDSIGRDWTFGTGELDQLVKNYDPAKFEAPLVIGHPKQEDPAFGWVEALKRDGEMLLALPKQLDGEFRKLVNEGRFKKISAKMTPDMKLLHVGFFGAYPTSIKDLPTVSLSDQDKDGFEIEFSDEWMQRTIADTFRRIREWIIEKFDAETADRVIPAWNIDALVSAAAESSAAPAFTEQQKQKPVSQGGRGGEKMSVKKKLMDLLGKLPDEDLEDPPTFSEAEVQVKVDAAVKTAKEEGKAEGKAEGKKEASVQFSEKERALKKTELITYVDGLIKGDGKKGRALVAAKKAGLVEFMLHLDDAEAIELAPGAEKAPMLAQMKAILETLPADITFSEVATKDKDVGDASGNKEKREKLIVEFQEKNKDATYKVAVLAISKEHPELFKKEE